MKQNHVALAKARLVKARNELSKAIQRILSDENATEIAPETASALNQRIHTYRAAAVGYRMAETGGNVLVAPGPSPGAGVLWVARPTGRRADAFLLGRDFPVFAVDPMRYVPHDLEIGRVYVLGLDEDILEIMKATLRLRLKTDVEMIMFSYYDGKTEEYTEADLVLATLTMLDLGLHPGTQKHHMRSITINKVIDLTAAGRVRMARQLADFYRRLTIELRYL